MRYCLRCCYPENARPAIILDEEGVCSGCRTFEERPVVNWEEKREQLKEILEHYKNLANKTEIVIGLRDESFIEVISGLNKGDTIVAEGLKKVRPNIKIKPIKK